MISSPPYLHWNEADDIMVRELAKLKDTYAPNSREDWTAYFAEKFLKYRKEDMAFITERYRQDQREAAEGMKRHSSGSGSRSGKRLRGNHDWDNEIDELLDGISPSMFDFELGEGSHCSNNTCDVDMSGSGSGSGGGEGEQVARGGGQKQEGMEAIVERPHKIWRRFPNTDNAMLKWVHTEFLNDVYLQTNTGSGNEAQIAEAPYAPFNSTEYNAATSLNAGGGGDIAHNNIWPQFTDGYPPLATNKACIGTDLNNPKLWQFKMTSPYNIYYQLAGTGLVTQGNVSHSQPCWLPYFDTKYEYYHCLETEWEFELYFGRVFCAKQSSNNFTITDVPRSTMGAYVFWKYTNQDDPPLTYNYSTSVITEVGTGLGPNVTSDGTQITGIQAATPTVTTTIQCCPDDYFRMGGWKHKHIMLNDY